MAALDLVDPSELNRHSEQLLSDQNSTAEDIRFDGYRVLVVEDGRDNQRILRFLLEEAGAKVGIAEDGREAVDEISAAGKDYDLVLMDVQMPVMDGYEATEKLRQIGFEAPIIAVTAYALPRDLERVLAAGCNDFVTKPLIPADLLRKVESWLSPREASVVHEVPDRPSRLTENERFRPLLQKFLAGLADRITAIESAQAEGDEAALLSLVHQLKGSAGSYGYPHLGDLARDCQDLLRSEEGQERLRPRLASLLEELRRLREEAEVLDPRV